MATETTPRHAGLDSGPIYLDYNATTPVDPRAVEAALPYLTEHFGNPSSTHHYGQAPKQAIRQARGDIARLLGTHPDEIVFTSGGSDSDTLAIRGTARANRDRGDHVITQATEHPAVLEACRSLETDGFRLTILPVDRHGQVDPADLHRAITDATALVSIMLANAETGTLQPIAELARIAHAHGALFHTDAAQAAGKIPTDVIELGVDLLTVVGHKMYAPKGIGALYVRAGTAMQPTTHGGGQEHGLHAGTESVALIAALGAAARIAADDLPGSASRLKDRRDRLHQRLNELLPERVSLNGHHTIGCPEPSTSPSPTPAARTYSRPRPGSQPPPDPRATRASTNHHPCCPPWVSLPNAPSQRCGSPSADGPSPATSSGPLS